MTLPSVEVKSHEARYRREWAKLIGKRRLDAFERALCDPELISMRQELVKIDLRITDLEERARKGESRGAWHHVKNFAGELTRLTQEEPKDWDHDKIRERIYGLTACAEQGLDDFKLWDEIKDLIERRRRVAAHERRIEEMNKLLIPVTLLARMFDDLHAAIEAVIPERTTQRALLHEVRVRLNADKRSEAATIPVELPSAYHQPDVAPVDSADPEADALEDE